MTRQGYRMPMREVRRLARVLDRIEVIITPPERRSNDTPVSDDVIVSDTARRYVETYVLPELRAMYSWAFVGIAPPISSL